MDTAVPDDASGRQTDREQLCETLRDLGAETARGEFLATYCLPYWIELDRAKHIVDEAQSYHHIDTFGCSVTVSNLILHTPDYRQRTPLTRFRSLSMRQTTVHKPIIVRRYRAK